MKTNILSFLLGICMMIILSAGTKTSSLFTIKQEVPKSIFVKGFSYNEEYEIQTTIVKFTKAGYVVKSLNGGGGSGGSYWYLIMEKY